jgi:hypothetical protein
MKAYNPLYFIPFVSTVEAETSLPELVWKYLVKKKKISLFQVGGHSPLFCLDPGTVCKPYVQREHIFYSSLPPALQPFIPFFKGCMKVGIHNVPQKT